MKHIGFLEAETEEDANQQALAWHEAVADGSGALDTVESDNRIASVQLSLDEVRETNEEVHLS